jgi:NAD(P)H-dependent FMN reductase
MLYLGDIAEGEYMKNNAITIAVLAGTTREGRLSINAAHYIAGFGEKLPDVEIIFVDPMDVHLPGDGNNDDAHDPKYRDITARADAFFIVTPEYNRSYPGSLKRMLDSEFSNYTHKPVALAGASNGPWGGTRACEALLGPLHAMGLSVIQPTVYFPFVQNIFDSEGNMQAASEAAYTKNIGGAYKELLWMARALKQARLAADVREV